MSIARRPPPARGRLTEITPAAWVERPIASRPAGDSSWIRNAVPAPAGFHHYSRASIQFAVGVKKTHIHALTQGSPQSARLRLMQYWTFVALLTLTVSQITTAA